MGQTIRILLKWGTAANIGSITREEWCG
jgi:hypothetical protein